MNFALEAPLFEVPGFLVNAAPHSQQIGLAAVVGLVIEALWLGIAVAVFTIPHQQRTALFFVALAAVILAVAVAENAGVMSMVSLSGAYAKADG